METQTFFIYGDEKYLIHANEDIRGLRDAVAEAKTASGGWVTFLTPGGGQANIYVQPETEVKIIREVR